MQENFLSRAGSPLGESMLGACLEMALGSRQVLTAMRTKGYSTQGNVLGF